MESVASQISCRFSKISSPTHSAFTCGLDMLGRLCNQHRGCPFDHFQTLRINLWHAALLLCHQHTSLSLSTVGEFGWGGECFALRTRHIMKPFARPSFQRYCHCISTYLLHSIWLTDWLTDWLTTAPAITCHPYDKCCFLQKKSNDSAPQK